MKLNPTKCAFGVSSGKFLSYMVSNRGIEANQEKIRAILDMQSPKNMKQLQQLAALIQEEEGVQKPVYFINRALRGAEERYPQLEKLAFALIIASRKLQLYFQAHTIRVLTEYPLKEVKRWQTFTYLPDTEQWPRDETWVVYVDGSSTRKHGGAWVVLITPEGEELRSSLKLEFKTTNNEAEYGAAITGLGLAREMGAEFIQLRSDSQVIVGHIRGEFKAKGDKMKLYLLKVQDLQDSFKKFCIVKIPREENKRADHLACIASTVELMGEFEELVQILSEPAITEVISVSAVEVVPDWQKEVVEYVEIGTLPSKKKSAVQLRKKAARFTMVNETLYKRGFMLHLLKCVSKEEGNYILRKIHEGIYGSHLGARMLAHKAVRASFYWPNMTRDSMEMVRNCGKCQRFVNPRNPKGVTLGLLTMALLTMVGRSSGTITSWKRGCSEKQDQAQETMSVYQERVARYVNKRVKHRSFKVGDLVLRKVTIATKDPAEGKLAPNWEGPYKVIECRRAGAFYLEDLEGKPLPRPWNAEHPKKYFV
ncbi:uncharacterized protein LOC132169637 [Corylus avellana]|uniref:uncharacterized protein LOC132169637 n=1 Tax=Corylus avellana TaxID=13451 RepID=UPI00286CABEE|nr:uncharacterized protein LOC132169637 [Corylus avellana]